MRGSVFAVASALLVASCASAPERGSGEERVFSRLDCQIISGNQKLEAEYNHSKMICEKKAEAAAISGTAAIPVGEGTVNAAFSGMRRGTAQRQIGEATLISCMGERDYTISTRAEFDKRCSARTVTPSSAGQ